MLRAAAVHPAMGLHLDNVLSTKDAPNENLGRELLELHTVGVRGGYTERDVKQSSRILTGYKIDYGDDWRAYYDPDDHYVGRIKVMGFRHRNRKRDGRKATRRYLRYLAHHPKTAKRIAKRLCVRFVSDNPPKSLVRELARVYLRHDTAIVPVLRALVDSREFRRSAGKKVKRPLDDHVAAMRALRIKVHAPKSGGSFANAVLWQASDMGQVPFDWPAPDGFPADDASWLSPGRVLRSFSTHSALAGGWWPKDDATFRPSEDWLGDKPMPARRAVRRIGKQLFGHKPPKKVIKAALRTVDMRGSDEITPGDNGWFVTSVLATLLNSPEHLRR